tara:strand:- start:462 stop:707 length:246 start_codon:yes stop_codon:yes gene_type:complete
MDAIAHTILAIASIAGAYYGGRWLLIREAREAFGESPELEREIKLMNAIMQRMVQEDNQYTESIKGPQQLDLFAESKHETS